MTSKDTCLLHTMSHGSKRCLALYHQLFQQINYAIRIVNTIYAAVQSWALFLKGCSCRKQSQTALDGAPAQIGCNANYIPLCFSTEQNFWDDHDNAGQIQDLCCLRRSIV